jgi:para-nitrobenzyl esterase
MHSFTEACRLASARVLALAAAAVLLSGCAAVQSGRDATLATIDSGALRGVRADGVVRFRGIPYAAAPVCEWRWRPPRPVPAWQGVRSARDYAPSCAQPTVPATGLTPARRSEDCLTLNVTTPTLQPAAPLPVMVWIHGGGFSQGSGNAPLLNGPGIPRRGVVLVTINYRLALFGFLAHPALARPGEPVGNYGLLDAVAALEWVQRNIAAFGGDPRRVTIFGESAGADAVNYLMVMPAARGLFQRAISQSSSVGMAPAPRLGERAGFNPPAESIATAFMAKLELPPTAAVGDAMRRLTTAQLLSAMAARDRFAPVVDGRTLPDQVGRLFAAGRQQQVPYMTGGNSWEASLGRQIGGGFSPAIAARLVPPADKARLYPGLAGDALDDAVFGDLVILSQSRYLALQMHAAGAPVHAWHFSYVASDRRARQPGAAHADDIAFVMGTLAAERDLKQITAADRRVSELLQDYWVQFAVAGDPNRAGLPAWPAWEPATDRTLEFGDTIDARSGFLTARMAYHVARGVARMGQPP